MLYSADESRIPRRMDSGKISKVMRVKEIALYPGRYNAMWSGYRVTITLDNGEVQMTTENGVRGFVPCVVEVSTAGEISLSDQGGLK